MEKKVSVIIPAYNVEKIVTYTIESALAQTLSDIEVIVVDDCSTDSTLAVLRERFGDHDKVRIVAQPQNGGVSMARNRGIQEAKGKYLAFLDSDDAMRPDMLEKMYAAAEEHQADVLHTTGCLLPAIQPVPDDIANLAADAYKTFIPELCEPGNDVYFAPEDTAQRLEQWYIHKYHWSVWNKLFRRSFIEEHGIRFDKLSMAEDMLFCFKALFYADVYAVLPGQWYVYRIAGASLSRQKSSVQAVIRLTDNLIKASEAASRFMAENAYFIDHPAERVKVQRMVCNSVDSFYLVPMLNQLTHAAVQESGAVSELFKREYGEKGAFVEYLYWRLHELLTGGLNLVDLESNVDELCSQTDDFRKNHIETINSQKTEERNGKTS